MVKRSPSVPIVASVAVRLLLVSPPSADAVAESDGFVLEATSRFDGRTGGRCPVREA
jgi:hypothetical protein